MNHLTPMKPDLERALFAEDMVREFKPEDFGLRPEDLAQVEKDPSRAFEILMKATSTNPAMLQTAMTRVGKKLQTKIQRGELKPEELAAEAEELMNEFQTHPAFAEMMKAFKSAFSFEDPAAARASWRWRTRRGRCRCGTCGTQTPSGCRTRGGTTSCSAGSRTWCPSSW